MPQTDEANLARIRDNQRRSRARRKEYQQELEQRVRQYEEQGIEASTEVQQAARRVADENRRLRALLAHHGVSHSAVETYLRTGDAAGTGADGAHVQVLERLMVGRRPIPFSPVPSAGAITARGGSPACEAGSSASSFRDPMCTATSSPSPSPSMSNPTAAVLSSTRRSGSHRSSGHGVDGVGSGGSGGGSSTGGHRSHHSDKGKKPVVNTTAAAAAAAAAAATIAASVATTEFTSDYLTGSYGVAGAAAGRGTSSASSLSYYSADDLQYAADSSFFDYGVSSQYLNPSGYDQQPQQPHQPQQPRPPQPQPQPHQQPHQQPQQHQQQAHGQHHAQRGGGMGGTGVSTAPVYFGGVPEIPGASTYVRPCPGCMSGLGCQVHGPYFED